MSNPNLNAVTPAKIAKVRARLKASVSGYVRTVRMSTPERTVLLHLIEQGEVEIFDSPAGRAYRLTEKGRASC